MYLSTWKYIEDYICLCFLILVLLKFLVFKSNDLTGLSEKDKFTEGRLIGMMNNVKEIQEKFKNQITKIFDLNNDNLS
ncbi:hypothetical protein VBM87_01570 [Mycoplasma sp. 744]|uniref:hypothetical protein n=1 Tax=Mycoplasma sp. 744 TaxID=3108531 RepID=UPI002B1DAE52|nr:hypothetical protein [Mycoplasma sp. 744]MEA4115470.1 hypothetical protein [Mycoplasma sp. 744]